jgi:hypothetical protein
LTAKKDQLGFDIAPSHARILKPDPPRGLPGGAPFAAGSETSREAAERIDPAAPTLRGRVLAFVLSRGEEGVTCDETEAALDLTHQTCSARIYELRHRARIIDGGERRVTRSGRKAVVWVAAEGNADKGTSDAD